MWRFQSSSGLLAGCNALNVGDVPSRGAVSILIRPSRRMQPATRSSPPTWPLWVSILIRPSRRMQPQADCHVGSYCRGFNPHPAFSPDATLRRHRFQRHRWRFQSSSGLLAGCNCPRRAPWAPGTGVSILIRPSRRMQPGGEIWSFRTGSSFNPHPAFSPDATSASASVP